MNERNDGAYRIARLTLCLLLSTILVTSSFLATARADRQGQIITRDESNWEYVNHDSWGTNYSPQNEINRENVDLLQIKWVYPFPPASQYAELQPIIRPTEGAMTPPLIVDGTVYVASNMRNVYALDAETGEKKWENLWEFSWEKAYRELPLIGGGTHIHGINYIDHVIYTSNVACSIRAIDASDGRTRFQIEDICKDVEGNRYRWPLYQGEGFCGLQSHPPSVYEKGRVLVAGICGADLNWGGRSFVDGYDLSVIPPKRIWRTFLAPPGEGDAEWALRNCDRGWFFSHRAWVEEGRMGIPCREVPRDNLMNDWGVPKHYNSAVSELWGHIAIDEETGLAYFGTGNQAGWINQTYATGPNLYASTIMAIDSRDGRIVWWYQTVPRDMVQGDVGWNTILAKINIGGEERKAVIKFTTTGLIWALDASTGEPIWIFEAEFLRSRTDSDGNIRGRYAGVRYAGANSGYGYWNDVRSYYDMQVKKWLNYPSRDPFYIIPLRAGEADIALDPRRGIIYAPVSLGWDATGRAGPFASIGQSPGDFSLSSPNQMKNTTIFAVDADGGNVIWSYTIEGVAFRGGIMTSGGVVFVPAADGFLYMLNSDTGELLHRRSIAEALVIQPTIGKTSKGESRLFLIVGGRVRPEVGGLLQQPVPGALIAFGLPESVELSPSSPVLRPAPDSPSDEGAQDGDTISPDLTPYLVLVLAVVIIGIAVSVITARKRAPPR